MKRTIMKVETRTIVLIFIIVIFLKEKHKFLKMFIARKILARFKNIIEVIEVLLFWNKYMIEEIKSY